MFRYESVNSTRKFTIVAEIVSLLKKIYKRDAPFRAVFRVKTLAVLFSAYPREMKHIPRNLYLPPFCRCLFLWKWCNPFPRARARLKHAHSFDRCGPRGRDYWCWPKGARPLRTRMERKRNYFSIKIRNLTNLIHYSHNTYRYAIKSKATEMGDNLHEPHIFSAQVNIWNSIHLNCVWRLIWRYNWSSQLCTQLKQLWN